MPPRDCHGRRWSGSRSTRTRPTSLHCARAGAWTSRPHPESLDVVVSTFVFTTLSPDALRACLQGLGRMLRPGGLLLFNLRPPEYWTLHGERHDHHGTGPRRFQVHEDEDDYGDLSTAGLRDLRVERSAGDPHQYLVHVRRSDA